MNLNLNLFLRDIGYLAAPLQEQSSYNQSSMADHADHGSLDSRGPTDSTPFQSTPFRTHAETFTRTREGGQVRLRDKPQSATLIRKSSQSGYTEDSEGYHFDQGHVGLIQDFLPRQ